MVTAVQRDKRKARNVPRKRLEAKGELSQSAACFGQRTSRTFPQSTLKPSTASVSKPITHLVAGSKVPVAKGLQSRFGLASMHLDGSMLANAEIISALLCAGVEHDWITHSSVNQLLSENQFGSISQGKEAFNLANKSLDCIKSDFMECMESAYQQLADNSFTSLKNNAGDWEIIFSPHSYEPDIVSEFEVPESGLVSCSSGLSVMQFDLLSVDDTELRDIIFQFIQFCCDISKHASSIDMILDDGVKWMCIGDLPDLKKKDETALINAVDDDEEFERLIIKLFGEDFEDMTMMSYDSLAEYYKSLKIAKEINKNIQTFSKVNVQKFLEKLKRLKNSPDWLISATEILLKNFNWTVSSKEYLSNAGHFPFAFTRPCAFGFPIEEHIFTYLHETLMYEDDENGISICVSLGQDTSQILANMDLGETLLLYVNEMLYQESTN